MLLFLDPCLIENNSFHFIVASTMKALSQQCLAEGQVRLGGKKKMFCGKKKCFEGGRGWGGGWSHNCGD